MTDAAEALLRGVSVSFQLVHVAQLTASLHLQAGACACLFVPVCPSCACALCNAPTHNRCRFLVITGFMTRGTVLSGSKTPGRMHWQVLVCARGQRFRHIERDHAIRQRLCQPAVELGVFSSSLCHEQRIHRFCKLRRSREVKALQPLHSTDGADSTLKSWAATCPCSLPGSKQVCAEQHLPRCECIGLC